MDKVDIPTAVKITESVAYFLINTDHDHAAAEFLKELLWLVNYCVSVLKIESAKEVGFAKINTVLALAVINLRQGNNEESKENAELALKISRQIAGKVEEQRSCMILSYVLFALARYEKGIDYLKEALSISQEIGDAKAEAQIFNSLGGMFMFLDQKQQAVECLQKSVEKSKDTGERSIEGEALICLGKVLIILGKFSETCQKTERAPEISKQIKDRKMEAEALYNRLGLALTALNKPRQSFLKLEESLKISEEIGDHASRVYTLHNVGEISRFYGPYGKSMECYRKALHVSRDVHDCDLEGLSYFCLGKALIDRLQYEEAGQCLENALEISKGTRDPDLEDMACTSLCNLYLQLGQHDKAREYRELVLKRVKEAETRAVPRSLTLLELQRLHSPEIFSTEEALRISSESIRCCESDREPLSDEYKISTAEIHEYTSAYKMHSLNLIILGKFFDALNTAERGRARVLTELLAKKYAIQEKFEFGKGHLNSLISLLTEEQVVVFIAIYENGTFSWVIKNDEPNLEMIPKLCRANDVLDVYTSPKRSRFLSQGRVVECEDRSLSALYDSESTAADEDENKKRKEERSLVRPTHPPLKCQGRRTTC